MIDQFQQLVEQERHQDMIRRAQAAALVTAAQQAPTRQPALLWRATITPATRRIPGLSTV